MDNSTGPIRSAPRAEKNKDDDGRPPKRTMSNEKDLPKAQAKLLKTTSGEAVANSVPGEEEHLEEAVERNHQDEEMDEVEQPPHPPLPTPTDWNTLHFVDGRLVGLPEVPASVHSDAKRREQEILGSIGTANNPNELKQRITSIPPTHITPKILNKLLNMMGPLTPCPHCKGSSHNMWEDFGSDGRAKCSTMQKSDMDKMTPCPGRLDATYLWMFCTGQLKSGNKAQLTTIFQRLFATIPIRKAPPPRMNLEAANHKATSAIAALLQNTENTLDFKEVQTTIQAQQTYIKGMEDHNQQLLRAFKQMAYDLHQAHVKTANADSNNDQTTNYPKPNISYATATGRRPVTRVSQALNDIAKLAETEQAAAYQKMLTTRRNPLTNTFLGKRTSAATRAPLNIAKLEDITNDGLKDRVRRLTPVRVENITNMTPSEARRLMARAANIDPRSIANVRKEGRQTEFLILNTEENEAETLRQYCKNNNINILTGDGFTPHHTTTKETHMKYVIRSLTREAAHTADMAIVLQYLLRLPDEYRANYREELRSLISTVNNHGQKGPDAK